MTAIPKESRGRAARKTAVTPLVKSVRGKLVDPSQIAEIADHLCKLTPGSELLPVLDSGSEELADPLPASSYQSPEPGVFKANKKPSTSAKRGNGSCAVTSAASRVGGRRSTRIQKRSAVVLANNQLAAEDMLTASLILAASERRRPFYRDT